MRIWAKTIKEHKIQTEVVQEFALARPSDLLGWTEIISDLCQQLDLARPVILNKHISELEKFSGTTFRASDFLESISFDRFVLEIFPEKKKDNSPGYDAY